MSTEVSGHPEPSVEMSGLVSLGRELFHTAYTSGAVQDAVAVLQTCLTWRRGFLDPSVPGLVLAALDCCLSTDNPHLAAQIVTGTVNRSTATTVIS